MKVITVSQLNRYVKSIIEGDVHLTSVYISGEISNFTNHYKSGHLYMSLKDEGAVVKAVMFRGAASHLKFMPESGMKVIVRARVSLYERDGAYQIYIEEMQPDGAGALQVAYEQLKRKLEAEGLFDAARKRPIPSYPSRVGVVTSETGAAVRDIMNVLGRRYPLATIVLVPVLVQGDGAAAQLTEAVRRLNETRAADVIIIGRGGGSIEDLWAFNDETLARTVAASHIPVISAVGHETDFTICDFAADLRAPTPSAAAELAVPDAGQLRQRIAQLAQRAELAVRTATTARGQQLNTLRGKRCLTSPLFYVEERFLRLDYLSRAFATAARMRLTQLDRRLSETAGKMDALSPLRVLARGYSIGTRTDGTVVHAVDMVQPGDTVCWRLSDGRLHCTVDTIQPEKEAENHG